MQPTYVTVGGDGDKLSTMGTVLIHISLQGDDKVGVLVDLG